MKMSTKLENIAQYLGTETLNSVYVSQRVCKYKVILDLIRDKLFLLFKKKG